MISSFAGDRFWQIQAVSASAGHEGGGFAYTIGLARQGLHELHIYATPTRGDDSGAGFSLSSADLGHILNELADEWVAGSLSVGDVRELSLDDGLTSAVVTVGDPVDAGAVEAWGAQPSLVVPLPWSLHRPQRGGAVEIMDHARGPYEWEIRDVATRCDSQVALAGAPLPGPTIDFDVDEPYGPLSALVSVHARAVASVRDVSLLADNALAAEAVVNPGALMGRMLTLSRLSGRDEQIEAIHWLGHRAVECLVRRRVWRDHLAETARVYDLSLADAQRNLQHLVGSSVISMLMSVALDDVLPEEMRLAAQGAWRATLSSSGVDPGPRWRCSDNAEQTIRRAFSTFGAYDLLHIVQSMLGPVRELLGGELLLVSGRALTTAVAPPPVSDLVLAQHLGLLSSPLVLQQLSLFAQLMATVIDGAYELDAVSADELVSILGWGVDESWWSVA